jgi:hypothetical protein
MANQTFFKKDSSSNSRRKFLGKLGLGSTMIGAGSYAFASGSDLGEQVNVVKNGIWNPFNFGAKGDGKTLDTNSIQKAIDACAKAGGGTVYFPSGKYLSGTLFLKSYITLYLDAGAVLVGSKNLSDYPVTVSKIRSYTDNYTNKSLIYGEGLENIAITGRGTLDGNGASFKPSGDLRKSDRFAWFKARPFMIRIINCKNVLVKEVTLINSAMWLQHYLACEDVNINGITVNSRVNGNNDGIDIDGCNNVRISNCNIISGDDAIVLKSSLDKPCKNVTITNCMISSDCNAFKLGTESNGNFENITLSNCVIYDTKRSGISFEIVDGGTLDRVSVSNVTMNNVGTAIFIRLGNRARPYLENDSKAYFNREVAKNILPKPGMGKLSNIIISNIQATNVGKTGCSITGLPLYSACNISINNVRLTFKGGGSDDLATREIEEFPDKYPSFDMFGVLPAYGFFCRHVKGLNMENIDLSYELPDCRPALYMQDVKDSRISDLKAFYEEGAESLIVIDSSQNIIISDCNAFKNIGALAAIKNGSFGIRFINNNLFSNNKIFISDASVNKFDVIVK